MNTQRNCLGQDLQELSVSASPTNSKNCQKQSCIVSLNLGDTEPAPQKQVKVSIDLSETQGSDNIPHLSTVGSNSLVPYVNTQMFLPNH